MLAKLVLSTEYREEQGRRFKTAEQETGADFGLHGLQEQMRKVEEKEGREFPASLNMLEQKEMW